MYMYVGKCQNTIISCAAWYVQGYELKDFKFFFMSYNKYYSYIVTIVVLLKGTLHHTLYQLQTCFQRDNTLKGLLAQGYLHNNVYVHACMIKCKIGPLGRFT